MVVIENIHHNDLIEFEATQNANLTTSHNSIADHCPSHQAECYKVVLEDSDINRVFLVFTPNFKNFTERNTYNLADTKESVITEESEEFVKESVSSEESEEYKKFIKALVCNEEREERDENKMFVKALVCSQRKVKEMFDSKINLSYNDVNAPVFICTDRYTAPLITIDGNHRLMAHFLKHNRSIQGVHAYLFVHPNRPQADWFHPDTK